MRTQHAATLSLLVLAPFVLGANTCAQSAKRLPFDPPPGFVPRQFAGLDTVPKPTVPLPE